jgi:hypothetical protein
MPNGHDKNWIRLRAAIEGFYVRYGHWPTRVRMFSGALADIRDHLFTPADFAQLASKVRLIADEAPFVAEDDMGNIYNYGQEGFERPSMRAEDWLRVTPKAED